MRMLTRALALAPLLLAAAGISAQTADPVYDILFDIDRNAATGCAASPTGAPAFGGYERRLRATLDPTTLTVDTVEVETCDGIAFQPLMPLTAGQPAGLNNGIDGTDVIELSVTTDALNLGNATLINLALAADSGAGSDILATQNGAPGGPPILLGLPVSIPTLSAFALLLLATLVVALAWRAHRRAGQLSAVGMVMLVAVVAWAMNFAADGDVSDWAGFSPVASDPDGDSTDGNSGIDLRAAFFAIENDALFFRLDLTDVENQAPVAVDDAFGTDEDGTLNVAAPGVLANDTDADGDPLTAVLQTGPANAQAFVLNADGSFDYTPNTDFNGSDSFTYLANDGQADSGVATVTITVNPINDPPTAADDTASTLEDDPVVVAVLANDTDSDGALDPTTVTVTTPPANGTAAPNASTGEITYTKSGDFNGMDSFIYEVCDDGTPLPSECASATVNVEVRSVNDAPSFTPGADQTVLEDAGAQTIAGWATAISAGPPDEAGQVLSFNVTANDNPTLFAAGPSIDPTSGNLSFTPADDANGTANITITLSDDGGTADGGVDTSSPVTFEINVTAVNDAPSFTVGADQTVLEDSGQSVVAGFLTDLQAGPPDEAGQALVLNVGNDNNALFSIQPAINEFGLLTFTPAADAFGSATVTVTVSDNGGTANGGVDTSPPATFTITVNAVNDAPSFTAGPNETVVEDAGPVTVAAWATAVSAGPPDEAGQVLTFNVTGNDNPGLFAAGPAIAADGTLSYTPAADAFGAANVTITLSDNGGTADGGVDTTAPVTFSITVQQVNDAPTFTAGPSPVDVLENSGAYSQPWATSVSPGPANEAVQSVNFNITGNSNAALFAAGPTLASNGTLSFTPTIGTSGSALITVELMDDGGTASGGVDTSPAVQFTINVLAINDAPSFTVGPDQTVDEDSGPQNVNGWATGIDDGDGGTQVVTFNITGNTNPGLFAAAPDVDEVTGNLTYTPAANAFGTATITLTLMDDGGTANGGSDTSVPQSFDITINPINDPPTVTGTPTAQTSIGNVGISVPLVGGLLDSIAVTDPDGAAGMPFNVSGGPGAGITSFTSANGGNVTITDAATGTYSYVPPAGFEGTDSFEYVVCDSGVPAPAACSAAITVNITVSELIWFVDAGAAAGGDGRIGSPFNDLAVGASSFDVNASDSVGDAIYLASGNYQGGLTLLDDQVLIGQGASGTLATAAGVTVPANSTPLPALGGSRPVLTATGTAITLGSDNSLRGFDIGNAPTGLAGNGFGTLTANQIAVSGTGQAISLVMGFANVTLDSIASINSPADGILLSEVGGSFTVTGTTTIDNAAGIGVNIQNVSAAYSFGDVTVNNRNSAGVFVNAFTGGAQTGQFGAVTINNQNGSGTTSFGIDNSVGGGTITVASVAIDHNNANGSAIALSNNTATINIQAGSVQNANGAAVSISSGAGTISYAGSINNAIGRSVQVLNNTGGTISLTGNVSDTGEGIVINNNTGASVDFTGALTLSTTTSDAFAATGGGTVTATGAGSSVTTTTGTAVRLDGVDIGAAGVSLQSVSTNGSPNGIVLNNTGGTGSFVVTGDGSTGGSGGAISNTTGDSVVLTSTRNIDLRYMNISSSEANGIRGNNVTDFALDQVTLSGNGNAVNEGGLRFDNLLGTVTINNSQITGSAEHNIQITNIAGTLSPLTISNSTIGSNSAALGADGLLLEARMSAIADVVVTSSTFSDNRSDGIQIVALNDASASLNVDDSMFTTMIDGSTGGSFGARAITLGAANNARLTYGIGSMVGNTFDNFTPNLGVEAINVTLLPTSTTSALLSGRIDNNIFTNSGGAVGVDARGNGSIVAQIDNNTATTSRQAIDVITGNGPGDTASADLTITNNQLTVIGTAMNPVNEAIGFLGDFTTDNCLNVRDNNAAGSGGVVDILIDDFTSAPGALSLESGPTDCGGACVNADAHLLSTNTIVSSMSTATLVAPGSCATP